MSRTTPILLAAFALLVGCGVGCQPTTTRPTDASNPLDPATDPASPDAPARELAKKNLSRIGLAMHNFESSYGFLPHSYVGKGGKPGLSWRVQILPFLEQNLEGLWRQFKLDESWDSEHNKKLIEKMPAVFASPGKPAEKGFTYLRSFTGPHAVISDPPPGPKPRHPIGPGANSYGSPIVWLTDGAPNTLVVAEAAEPVIWTKPDELLYNGGEPDPTRPKPPLPKLGGVFPGGFHGMTADATIHWFHDKTPDDTIRALITVNCGEDVNLPTAGSPKSIDLPPNLPDAADRTAAVERLQLIHTGLRIHDVAFESLPAGIATKDAVGLSWRVAVLPFLRKENLYRQFKLDEPWDSEHNKKLIEKMPDVFASPGKPAEKGHTYLRTTRGPDGVIFAPILPPDKKPYFPPPGVRISGRKFNSDVFGYGWGKTVLVAESDTAVPWTKPDEIEVPSPEQSKTAGPLTAKKMGGAFDGGFHAALVDGSVVFYKPSLPDADFNTLLAVVANKPRDPKLDDHILYTIKKK